MSSLRITDELLELVIEGKKTSTIRRGLVSVTGNVLSLVSGKRSVKVEVLAIDHSKHFGDLGAEDAQRDGFATSSELKGQLLKFYRDISPEEPVTIIRFAKKAGP